VDASLSVGVSYADFGGLIRELSKELLLARDRVRYTKGNPDPQAQRILESYSRLLAMYQDSAKVWQAEIQDRACAEVTQISEKYGVKIETNGVYRYIAPDHKRYDFEPLCQAIWQKASKLQEEQLGELYDTFVPEEPKRK
jgi:hypothetical protein